ncbi:zinc finger, CCHC-type containing protein, partial [Tanacetum coccineum]
VLFIENYKGLGSSNCATSVRALNLENLPQQPMRNQGIAKVELAPYRVGLRIVMGFCLLEQGSRAVVRLLDPKRKTLGEKGIDCIFVGYAEHSKAYRFYVIEPNDSVSINSIIESIDAIFDENLERSRDQIGSQYSYCYSIEEDPRTYNEAMQSCDAAFWKKAIDDEIGSIMENNTWVLSDLPPGCKPLGCKWIFKRKMEVDGTIDKFKARLVIQGFRQKEGIDYFDTYAPVARITTVRLLLALAAIHNLVIHQMDVKTNLNVYYMFISIS